MQPRLAFDAAQAANVVRSQPAQRPILVFADGRRIACAGLSALARRIETLRDGRGLELAPADIALSDESSHDVITSAGFNLYVTADGANREWVGSALAPDVSLTAIKAALANVRAAEAAK